MSKIFNIEEHKCSLCPFILREDNPSLFDIPYCFLDNNVLLENIETHPNECPLLDGTRITVMIENSKLMIGFDY